MKKLRIVFAVTLAVVLVLMSSNVPTFSWFTRPQDAEGEKMVLGGDGGSYSLNAYNGNGVVIATKSSSTGKENSYTTLIEDSAGYSGSGISTHNRKYFCTTITNNSGDDQNVSLYVRTLSIPTGQNGTLALGVNSPTRSYRDYSALAAPSTKTTHDVMRIYFEKDNNVTGWNGTEFYICWNEDSRTSQETLGDKGQNGTYYKLTHVGGDSNPNQYYADIPKTATHAFFAVENWGTNNDGNPNWGQRSQELCNLASDGQTQESSKLFKITSDYKNGDSNSNHLVHTPPYTVFGNCINSYYSNIFVASTANTTFNAALSSDEYIGTLKYYSGDKNLFTVDENTGVITPKAGASGQAILYTKSTGGSYPDEQQVETVVNVTSASNYVFNDVPIVKNILLKGDTTENKHVIEVYWYIINNSLTNTLSYTIDQVYLAV